MALRAISYGAGVQSTALLILAARREIDFPLALFANVGDDSEHPASLAYFRDVAVPYAADHGIELVELKRHRRDGTVETLMDRIMGDSRSIPIPMRLGPTMAPGNRTCTQDFKIRVVAKELKRRGAMPASPATIALGISLDEYQRMRTESGIAWELLAYPLIDLGLDRANCVALIEREGLPVPPRSACFFCPYHKLAYFRRMRRDDPDLFAVALHVERTLHERGTVVGRTDAYLTRTLRPLDEAVGDHDQLSLFDGATCDVGGYCHA